MLGSLVMRSRLVLLGLVLLLATLAAGHAQAPGMDPARARQLLEVLQDPARRDALIANLQALEQALPAGNAAAPASGAPSSANANAKTPASDPKPAANAGKGAAAPPAAMAAVLPLVPDSLGAQLLERIADLSDQVSGELTSTFSAVTNFPGLLRWGQHLATNPRTREAVLQAGWRLVLVFAIALGAAYLARRGLRKITNLLAAHAPRGILHDDPPADTAASESMIAAEAGMAAEAEAAPAQLPPASAKMPAARSGARLRSAWLLLRRLPYMMGAFLLDLLPVLLFAAIGNGLMATPLGDARSARLMILALVNATVLCGVIICVARVFLAPEAQRLRLLRVSDRSAAFLLRWVRRLSVIAVFGYAVTQIGLLFGLGPALQEDVLKLVGLVVNLGLVVMVLQCRGPVAARLRGGRQGQRAVSAIGLLRARFADIWHLLAAILLLGIWFVYAAEVHHGVERLFHVLFVTVAVLVVARLIGIVLLGALDRALVVNPELASRFPELEIRAARYYPMLRLAASVLVSAIALVAMLQFWGFSALAWFAGGRLGGQLLSVLATLVVTFVCAALLWEGANAWVQRYLRHLTEQGDLVRSARLRTLLPMLRTMLLVAILVIIGLTALSQVGLNIAPLLAGAGILGVALGFGSQKLVQDLITGLFLLLENAMQVGDWVTAAGLSGSVEHLSIRTLWLRAGDGSVHIIPFSAVSTLTNTNRGLGNASVSVGVSYEQDTDQVGALLKQIALDMRAEDAFRSNMLSDLQLWGVDKVDGMTVTIAGQIVCTDRGRWAVQREFNRRMKLVFQREGIAIAMPGTAMMLRHPLDVRLQRRETGPADE